MRGNSTTFLTFTARLRSGWFCNPQASGRVYVLQALAMHVCVGMTAHTIRTACFKSP